MAVDVSDITPLSNLTELTYLTLHWNELVDITPLAHLTQLTQLRLTGNRIVDISPIANLTMLEELWIATNRIIDFSPIEGLQLKVFHKDDPCIAVDLPIEPRIENRDFPSIFQAWNAITNLPELSAEDKIALHDVYWHGQAVQTVLLQTDSGSHLVCDIEQSNAMRDELLARNPNMLFLTEVRYRDAVPNIHYPEDWFGWVRDENGNLVTAWAQGQLMLVDFTLLEVQDIIVGKCCCYRRKAVCSMELYLIGGMKIIFRSLIGVIILNVTALKRLNYKRDSRLFSVSVSKFQRIFLSSVIPTVVRFQSLHLT